MKLNKRAGLLILPVITFGYFLAYLGVYHSQRTLVVGLEQRSVEMQVSELADTISNNARLAEDIVHRLMQGDKVPVSVAESGGFAAPPMGDQSDASVALGVAAELLGASSLAVIDHAGEVRYFSSGANSGAGARERHSELAESMLELGRTRSLLLVEGSSPQLLYARRVASSDFPAMRRAGLSDAVVVVLGLGAVEFSARIEALTANDRNIEWLNHQLAHDLTATGAISAWENLPPFGSLRVSVPSELIERQLDIIKYVLAVAFLAITTLSHFVLGFLIRRYITRPINRLERELAEISYDSKEKLLIHDSNDEIGSLSRTFAGMYENLRKSYQIAREMAERDGLTRLYNRRMFNHHIEQILQRATAENGKVALLYIDVDNFKFINDKYGHGTGDELLRTFSDRLGEVLRPGDLMSSGDSQNCSARLAGDEFAVILHSFEDDDVPRKVAARVLAICDRGYLMQSARVHVSLSIGVACFPQDASNSTELISNADTAMYQAKNKGKNQFSFYSRQLASQARRKVEIETQLKNLDYSEFSLHYMPIVEGGSLSIAGVEALVRWKSKSLGWVSPAEFITIAESMGAFREIDRWVINQVSSDLPVLRQSLGQDVKVSVNISSAELESREFFDEIAIMVEHGFIMPDSIELEITETFHLDHRHDSEEILRNLGKLGFSISIDDFGTGFTSLVQLVEYPIDKIKLDKSFVDKVLQRERVEIISSLVEFCKSQNFSITAEGVETPEQALILSETGCDFLQGFYFSKPLPLDLLVEFADRARQNEGGGSDRSTVVTALHGLKAPEGVLPAVGLAVPS